jgi:carboxyl-terminal processing protease
LLKTGVAVADRFLQRGQVIVSARGRAFHEQAYYARSGVKANEYPIVVLVDKLSASASEIVAGALQDHDRAWILGEKTFGKGLVQTVFQTPEATGLALTTAHFYTPSGRLIQRDYTGKSFYDYYYNKDENAQNPLDVKTTDAGRTVYGGGGITPDEKFETPKLDKFQTRMFRTVFFNFSREYFGKHEAKLPEGWMPDDKTLAELKIYMVEHKIRFTEEEFKKHREWIQRYLAKEMYVYAFNVDESARLFARTDPEVKKAIEAMPKAVTLLQSAKKVFVQRRGMRPGADQ